MPDGPCLDRLTLDSRVRTRLDILAGHPGRKDVPLKDSIVESRESKQRPRPPLLGRCTLGRGALQVAFSLMVQERQVRVHLPAGLLGLSGCLVSVVRSSHSLMLYGQRLAPCLLVI
jgi:hypothetical protein